MTYDRKAAKRQARGHVKRHYVLLVALCAVSIFLGTEFTGLVSNAQTWYDLLTGQVTQLETVDTLDKRSGNSRIIEDLIKDNLEAGNEEAAEQIRRMEAETDPTSALGRSRGIFAAIANNISSGKFYATLGSALHTIVHSQQVTAILIVLLSALLHAMVWVFLKNMYCAVLRRAFLETRRYDAFPLGHLLHFKLVKRWNRAALTLLLQAIFQTLWDMTIVGGFIKRYSYCMTPYIVAENPDIRPREAIKLSRRMMNGHKMEFFKLDVSLLGWWVLGFVTFGATEVLWSVPYQVAIYTEYYALLRREAQEKKLPDADRLNDDWLFEAPDGETLRRSYADVTRFEGVLDDDIVALPPRQRFFARNFGIWTGSLEEKKVYSRQEGLRQQTRVARQEMEGKAYPQRMNPLWSREAAAITGRVNYLAPCTVWSLVVVFFSFCLVGWLWEVSLHFISHGEFVNRGALHGPWLPIYGGGVAMITVLLYRFRKKPALEAVLVMILCGFVEYMTSLLMELTQGMRWWDYSGYFLNLNGRICGEGLAVFAVGGMAAIYFLVPLIDSAVTRAKPKILIPVCVTLLVIFGCDYVYSQFVPNVGPGITDIGEEAPAAVEAVAAGVEGATAEEVPAGTEAAQ